MGHVLNIHEVDDFRLDPYQRPEAGAADVVIRVKACGICGSDLTYIKHGGIHRKPGGVTPLGHEAAGDVMFVGKDVSGVEVGQRSEERRVGKGEVRTGRYRWVAEH